MKNTKRILAVVIALTMVIGMFASVSAASGKWYSKAVTYLEAAGIAKIGTKAETKLTRAEFVLWVAKLEAGANFVESGMWKKDGLDDVIVFSDVDTSVDGIYRSAINYCYQRRFVRGNGDGTFSPDAKVTLAQASAVIVRLMGYENKVTNLEDWQYNYFNVANNYCNAFDKTFADHLPAVDAEYELTYGEAAYLLATILNWGDVTTSIGNLRCLTSEGENLGEKFPAGSLNASSQIAIVSGVDFVEVYYDLYGGTGKIYDDNGVLTSYTSEGGALNYNFVNDTDWTSWGFDATTKTLDFVSNVIDPSSSVTLNLIGENGTISNTVTVSVATFQQLVRVSLGKSKNVDRANGEVFNLGDYINNGSVVGVEVSGETVTSVTVATEDAGTRLVSDTFLVLQSTSEKWVRGVDGSIIRYGKYPYLANAESGLTNKPQLLTSYTDAKKVSVSGSKLTLGETTYSIVQTRTVGEKELVVYDVSADVLAPLSASTVAARIPNTAAGEHDVEFTDVDGDGFFDVAVIRDYSTFKYVDKTNADPASNDSGAKYNQGGAVVIDKKVTTSGNSDSWKYDSGTSGKVQIVVQASNKHNALRTQYYGNTKDAAGNTVTAPSYPMQYYTVVDIADLTTAYIESVEKDVVKSGETCTYSYEEPVIDKYGDPVVDANSKPVTETITVTEDKTYFVATLVNVADGTKAKVLIPTKSVYTDTRLTVPVTIAGQSTKVSVYSADWMPFLAAEEAARENGIDQIVNEEGTGSWLVDKTVKYATKGAVTGATGFAADMVCVMLDTTSTAATGFIVDVKKTETGDNTYNVTIAKSGNISDPAWVSALDVYFTRVQNNLTYTYSTANYPAYNGNNLTARGYMALVGFTDADAYVADKTWTSNTGYTRAEPILRNTFAILKAKGVAGTQGKTLAQLVGAAVDPSDNNHPDSATVILNQYTVINAAATNALTIDEVLNAIPGFSADAMYEKYTANKSLLDARATSYARLVGVLTDIARGGYLTTSKTQFSITSPAGLGSAPAKGWFTAINSYKGATSVATYEVRASASSIWDWDNYSVYYGIFAGQTLKDHLESNTNVQGEISINSINEELISEKAAALAAAQAALAEPQTALAAAQAALTEPQTALTEANTAKTTADEALTSAQTALTEAQAAAAAEPENEDLAEAVTTAQAAVDTAQAAVDTAQAAVDTAQAAVDAAQAAVDAAQTAVDTAQAAVDAAQADYNKVSDVKTKKAAYDAATSAHNSAVAALEAANAAVVTATKNLAKATDNLAEATEKLAAAQADATANPNDADKQAALTAAQTAKDQAASAKTAAEEAKVAAEDAVPVAEAAVDAAAERLAAAKDEYLKVVEFTAAVTGQDLTYVAVKKDAATTSYVLQYLDETSSVYKAGLRTWGYYYSSNNSTFADVWSSKGAFAFTIDTRNEAAYWNQYSQGIILTDISKAVANIVIPDGQNSTETEFTVEVATNPYYRKLYNAQGKVTGFERHWTVGQYTLTVTSSYVAGDPIKTYLAVVDANGEQIKVEKNDESFWTTQAGVETVDGTTGNKVVATFEVIKGLLYRVNTYQAEYKYNSDGKRVVKNEYDFSNMVAVDGVVPKDVAVEEEDIVGLITLEEMTDRTEKGYFPGAYKVTYDGKTYIAAGETPVVIMTPNFKTADLDGRTTTIEALAQAKAEVFVTYAQPAASGTSLDALSVIGELVDKTVTPVSTETEKTYLVYLAHDGVTIEALENGNYFVVRSTYSASVIPSCEDFGSIYRKYSTYTEAKYASTVDVAISTGYYTVKADGEIVGAAGATKKGEITEVDSVGNVKATLDGKKVDATGYKWTFIYEDFEGNLHVAGSSTSVSISSEADVLKTLDDAKKALADAEKDYADAQTLKLSAEVQATLKAVVDEKAAALETAKTTAIAKYLDGQFWGGANSSVYRYINSYKYTYQKEPSPVTFQYTVIDGTYVVFVNSFFA